MDRKQLGKRMKEARKVRGLTAKQLSILCHIDDTYVRQIENGTKVPSLPVFIDLCNVLQVSSAYLLRDSLTKNEYAEMGELSRLWNLASSDQIDLVTAMVRAALEYAESVHTAGVE